MHGEWKTFKVKKEYIKKQLDCCTCHAKKLNVIVKMAAYKD